MEEVKKAFGALATEIKALAERSKDAPEVEGDKQAIPPPHRTKHGDAEIAQLAITLDALTQHVKSIIP